MTTKILKSVRGRRARFTRLDSAGVPVVGPCSRVVTDGFVSVVLSAEIEAGEEITLKNAWGEFCISEKSGDLIKWVNVTVKACQIDPDVLDMVGGMNPIVFPANTVATVTNKALSTNVATLTTSAPHNLVAGDVVTVSGVDATFNGTFTVASAPTGTTFTYAKTASNVTSTASSGSVTKLGTAIGGSQPTIPNPDGYAIEVWTKNAANPAEWGYFVQPYILNGMVAGDITIENGAMTVDFTGQGFPAVAAWGINPYGDNPLLVTSGMPVGDLWAAVTTTVVPPALTSGCQPILTT